MGCRINMKEELDLIARCLKRLVFDIESLKDTPEEHQEALFHEKVLLPVVEIQAYVDSCDFQISMKKSGILAAKLRRLPEDIRKWVES